VTSPVCPWWLGYTLITPLRKLWHDPAKVLAPYVTSGMTVLEPGCGMGYFTLELARRVGASGKVIAVDLQPKMLDGMKGRAVAAGVGDRIAVRTAQLTTLGVDDLEGRVDFALAFFFVHEVRDADRLFRELHAALKPGGRLLFVEPVLHVSWRAYARSLALAQQAGLAVESRPRYRLSRAAVLSKPDG
jgi:ubiquinone/menaquinone biosynthesis C-methylase UbiE